MMFNIQNTLVLRLYEREKERKKKSYDASKCSPQLAQISIMRQFIKVDRKIKMLDNHQVKQNISLSTNFFFIQLPFRSSFKDAHLKCN